MTNGTESNNLHVLFLPSFYADKSRPVIGTFFKEQARAVARTGTRVGVVYVEPRRLRALSLHTLRESHWQTTVAIEAGLPTMRMHGWNPYAQSIPGGLVWSFSTQHLIGTYIKQFGPPDVIHAHNALWAGHAAREIKRRLDIPYIVTEHSAGFVSGNIGPVSKQFARRAYREASQVLVVGKALGKAIESLLPDGRYQVVPNCVDTDIFSLPPTPRANTPFVYLAVAHLVARKGFDILLRAFAASFRNDSTTSLVIGGDGPERAKLTALARDLGIESQVHFLGSLSPEGVRDAMWSANAFVLPSHRETFGVVVIEAMATGIPVIATNCGGPEDVVTADTGIIIEPADCAALSNAMTHVRKSAHFESAKVHRIAESNYGQEAIGSVLVDVYQDAVRAHECGSSGITSLQ